MSFTEIENPTKKQILTALKDGWIVGQIVCDSRSDFPKKLCLYLPNPDKSKLSPLYHMSVPNPGEEVELAIAERNHKDIQFIVDPYPSVVKRAEEIKNQIENTLYVK